MSLLHSAVLKTRKVPGLREVYKGIYIAAANMSARALQTLPDVSAVYLHRGLSRAGWEPGVSDIDLIALLRDGRSSNESELLSGLARKLSSLKRTFPMLGDIWLGSRQEAQAYLRWGGLRAWEDAPHWKLLGGEELAVPNLLESRLKKKLLDAWSWAFVAQMELSRRTVGTTRKLTDKDDADAIKAYLDVCRYTQFLIDDHDKPMTRIEMRGRLTGIGNLPLRQLWLDSSQQLARASKAVWSHIGRGDAVKIDFPRGVVPEIHCSGSVKTVLCDPPYHTYFVLASGSVDDYERALQACESNSPRGVPLILERETLALALQSSYLGAPLGWLGNGGGLRSAVSQTVFPAWGATIAGEELPAIPVLPARLRWEIAAEAASWMLLWWRSLWISPGWSNRFVLHHLYTRALGLRVQLENREVGPFCDWEMQLACLSAVSKDERRLLARLRDLLLNEPDTVLDSTKRSDLAAGHLVTISNLMASLFKALPKTPTP